MELKLAYITLTLIMLASIAYAGIYAINTTIKDVKKKALKKKKLVIGLFLWQLYIFIMAESGFIASYSFPPKFGLTLILPSFIFTGLFVYKNRDEKWLKNIGHNHRTRKN